MQHVKAIQEMIDEGKADTAHHALDDLLELGPSNIEALKMKAYLFAGEGRYSDEAEVWSRVLKVDNEDIDGINFLLKQQTEDREHFYFTDDIPGGGRRYIAYPKAFISATFLAILGCASFVAFSYVAHNSYPILTIQPVMLGMFGLMVVAPWIGIMITWIKSPRAVTIDPTGLEVATRFGKHAYKWLEMAAVSLAHDLNPDDPILALVLVPRDKEKKPLVLDLSEDSSSIRAKSHLIREIQEYFSGFQFARWHELGIEERSTCKF